MANKLVCVTVGLPARGKTFIAQKIKRYLRWLGIRTRVFNVGDYRRRLCGNYGNSGTGTPNMLNHEFFDATNVEASLLRHESALLALNDMIEWLTSESDESQVAIYDATNSTRHRRKIIHENCLVYGISILFIESICNDEEIIRANILEVKLGSPDYASADNVKDVVTDFCNRIKHYEKIYETICGSELESHPVDTNSMSDIQFDDESNYSFVKLIDVGERAVINQIHDYRQSQIVYFLLNLHIRPRSIYITRHGETLLNREGRIGGDSHLSTAGLNFAQCLPKLVRHIQLPNGGELAAVWTSSMMRTIETAQFFPPHIPVIQWRALNEIDAGVCEGLTYEEIESNYPAEFAAREAQKFRFRYKGGESYADLITRLEPVIIEAERQESVLIIGHQAVLRAILGYFLGTPLDELPYLKIPLHTLIQLTPRAYGCEVACHAVSIASVNTHRSSGAPGKVFDLPETTYHDQFLPKQ